MWYGDGSQETSFSTENPLLFQTTHTYNAPGTYTVSVTGTLSDTTVYTATTNVTALVNDITTSFSTVNTITSIDIFATADQSYDVTAINPKLSVRSIIPSSMLTGSGNYIRVKLPISVGSGTLTIKNVSIGEKSSSGNAWDTSSKPHKLTINGNDGITLSINQDVYTDWTYYPINSTKSYILIIDYVAPSAQTIYPTKHTSPTKTYYIQSMYTYDLKTISPSLVLTSTNPLTYCRGIQVHSGNPNEIVFTDTTVGYPNEWFWDFGDGTSSSLQNTTHMYTYPGTYTASLYSSNQIKNGTTSKSITISNPSPIVTYGYDRVSNADIIFVAYEIVNKSLNESIISWVWDFGDGVTSNLKAVRHTYTQPGYYTITITATNNYGISTTMSETIYISLPYNVKFSPCYDIGGVGHNVDFYDLTLPQNDISNWSWDFGDGNTSTLQNPSHTYTTEGIYSPSLTITYSGGTTTLTKLNTIMINKKTKVLSEQISFSEGWNILKILYLIDNLSFTDIRVPVKMLYEKLSFINKDLPNYGTDEYGHSFKGYLTSYGVSIYNTMTSMGRKIIIKTPLNRIDCFKTLTFMKLKDVIVFKQQFEKYKL